MSKAHRIVELFSIIASSITLVDDYLTTHNLPTPSLGVDATPKIPIPDNATQVEAARMAVIEATAELRDLMSGPLELLRLGYTDYVSLKAITRFNLAKTFPVGEEASFEAIAHASGMDTKTVRRILRHGMTTHLFHEPSKGMVSHTGLTKLLAEDDLLRDNVANTLDEVFPAAVRAVDAMAKWPGSEEPNQTGFSLANNTEKTMWEVYADDVTRGERFGRAMSFMSKVKGYDEFLLLENYPWAEIQTMVDVGGSHGTVATSIARRFPGVKCIVQDLPEVVNKGRLRLPTELVGRVDFMDHDFFTQQRVTADVYYFRSIFHNWSDRYSIQILRGLIPALKRGARILINDFVLPEPNVLSPTEERRVRDMDIAMLQMLNAQERDADEWDALFRQADSRFRYLGARNPPGMKLWFIEASWEG